MKSSFSFCICTTCLCAYYCCLSLELHMFPSFSWTDLWLINHAVLFSDSKETTKESSSINTHIALITIFQTTQVICLSSSQELTGCMRKNKGSEVIWRRSNDWRTWRDDSTSTRRIEREGRKMGCLRRKTGIEGVNQSQDKNKTYPSCHHWICSSK